MKTKNTFTFSFVHAMKKNFIVPILTFIGLLGCLIASFSNYTYEIETAMKIASQSNQNFRDILRALSFKFILFTNEEGLFFITVLGVIGASALLGILLFRFASSKKTVNVYYSLGITRTELYSSRYLAGITMLFGAIIVAFLIMTLVNIYCFGSSVMLWKSTLFFILHFCTIAFASFSITAAVSSSVGTIIEAIAFSAIIILSTSFVSLCITDSLYFMIPGAPKSTYMEVYNPGTVANSMYYSNALPFDREALLLSNSFLGRILKNIDLIFLNYKNIFVDGMCFVGRVVNDSTFDTWKMPPLTPYILWIIGGFVFFALGLFMFKRKKAEICGFMGRNKILNFIISAILSFLAFCGVITMLGSTISPKAGFNLPLNMWSRALIGIIISFLVFTIIELLLTRSFKAYKKNIKISLVHIALILLLVFSLHLGFFGYSSYIPDIEDIKSVNISMPSTLTGARSVLSHSSYADAYWAKDHIEGPFACYYTNTNSYSNAYMLSEFTDKESIQFAVDFHQKLIDEGWIHKESDKTRLDYSKRTVKVNATIVYTLKDGRKIARGYDRLPLDLYEEMFKIEDTDEWNKIAEFDLENFTSSFSIPVIFSQQMDKKTFVDENLVNGLGHALANDMKALNYTSFWRSDADWLGCVALFNSPDLPSELPLYGYNGKPINPQEFSNDTDYINKLIATNWEIGNEVEFTPLIEHNYVIPITSEMKNTISFLQSNGLYETLSDESEIVSAKVIEAATATANIGWSEPSAIFNAFWDNGKATPERTAGLEDALYYQTQYTSGDFMPDEAISVTDKELIKELENNAYGIYLDTNGGYIVEFTRANGNTTIMFVPNGRITQEIK